MSIIPSTETCKFNCRTFTKKLLGSIAAGNDVTLIDVSTQADANLSGYDRICFASGIYYNKFAGQILSFAAKQLPEDKPAVYIYTHGAPDGNFPEGMRRIAEEKGCREVGGIAKGHPTEYEIQGAVDFYEGLVGEH